MDAAISMTYALIGLNGILVGIVAFFLRQLLDKFDKMETSLNSLSKEIAVIVTRQDHHIDRFSQIDHFEERIDKEVKSVRERLHVLSNDINGLISKCEITHEKCPSWKNRD